MSTTSPNRRGTSPERSRDSNASLRSLRRSVHRLAPSARWRMEQTQATVSVFCLPGLRSGDQTVTIGNELQEGKMIPIVRGSENQSSATSRGFTIGGTALGTCFVEFRCYCTSERMPSRRVHNIPRPVINGEHFTRCAATRPARDRVAQNEPIARSYRACDRCMRPSDRFQVLD